MLVRQNSTDIFIASDDDQIILTRKSKTASVGHKKPFRNHFLLPIYTASCKQYLCILRIVSRHSEGRQKSFSVATENSFQAEYDYISLVSHPILPMSSHPSKDQ